MSRRVRREPVRARRAVEYAALFAVAATFFVTGCGYSLGFRAPANVATVAVPIFDNLTFPLRRDVEYDLTAAVRRELLARTELVLADSAVADLVVHGRIRDFEDRVIAEGRFDEKIEASLRVAVDLVVEDHRRGTRWEQSLRATEPFSVELGEALDDARRRVVAMLAERIVNSLDGWDGEDDPVEDGGDGV